MVVENWKDIGEVDVEVLPFDQLMIRSMTIGILRYNMSWALSQDPNLLKFSIKKIILEAITVGWRNMK